MVRPSGIDSTKHPIARSASDGRANIGGIGHAVDGLPAARGRTQDQRAVRNRLIAGNLEDAVEPLAFSIATSCCNRNASRLAPGETARESPPDTTSSRRAADAPSPSRRRGCSSIISLNVSMERLCTPSHHAVSGHGWTSTMKPSAPAATAASAIAGTSSVWPARVAGVDDDRQVRVALDDGHGGDVERVARGVLERADAALAEHHLLVAVGEDVLGGQQQLFDRAHHAALQQHGLALLPTASSSA